MVPGMSDTPTLIVKGESVGGRVGQTDTSHYRFAYYLAMTGHQSLGELVRDLRKRAELTQMELATEIGIARSTLASIETGSDLPGRETLMALADFFKVPLDNFRTRTAGNRQPRRREVVEDPDELALLSFWRSLSKEQRVMVTRLMDPAIRR
jgi:transcriptional regulator with XRE-family HTH domain